eukprot:4499144-Pyramimonas_sp.AAC.1
MRGFSLVRCCFYGHSGVGFRDANVGRLSKLGGLLRPSQIPWIVAADWDLSPESVVRSGWLERVGGQIACSGAQSLAHQQLEKHPVIWTI